MYAIIMTHMHCNSPPLVYSAAYVVQNSDTRIYILVPQKTLGISPLFDGNGIHWRICNAHVQIAEIVYLWLRLLPTSYFWKCSTRIVKRTFRSEAIS